MRHSVIVSVQPDVALPRTLYGLFSQGSGGREGVAPPTFVETVDVGGKETKKLRTQAELANEDATGGAPRRDEEDRTQLLWQVGQTRSVAAFEALFQYYGPRLKKYLQQLGSPADVADEIFQDVMINVWRKAQLFDRGRATATTWIYRVARNRRIDRFRRIMTRTIDPSDPTFLPMDAVSPEVQRDTVHVQRELRFRLSMLSHSEQTVLSLAYYKGLSHAEIANALSMPLGTVKSRIRVSFEKLRKAWAEGPECLKACYA